MKLPNLLVPGAQKGGTTTIHRMLSEHPDIFMSSNKEPGLFHNRQRATDEEISSYAAHFEKAPSTAIYIGESTAHYFWEKSDESVFSRRKWRAYSNVPLIRDTLAPGLRVVLALRHPVDRAISGYNHHATKGRISAGETILDAAKRPELGIVDLGFYTRHYKGWAEGLPDAKFFLVTTDELSADTAAVYERLTAWLELPDHKLPDSILNTRWNSADRMRQNARSTMKEGDAKEIKAPEISEEEKADLFDIFKDEIKYWRDLLPGAGSWRTDP